MPDVEMLIWAIPLFPLLGAALSALMGVGRLRSLSHLPCVLAAALSFVVAALLLSRLPEQTPMLQSAVKTWFEAGPISVKAGLVLDPLSAIMLMVITFIGFWIAVFSIGYMHGEEGYARFFACVGLFLFSMTLLVLADNFLLLFAGWEGVGLCSYLLVGFWYAKPSAAAAARKAFLVTRLGDVGMILGIFLLWSIGGHSLNFEALFAGRRHFDGDTLSLACLLIFCGAVGKSAQIPLYVWLPDAMEGPTPVSALIHAATMVTAGVYLLARCAPLFVLCPGVQLTVAAIGGFTALLGACIALTQHDLKRVLAYSTVSQIGYMFLALGTGGKVLANVAVAAAVFHLFTHAFFKAVLFLSAGSVMHAMGNVIDMRKFSGLRRVMPVTHLTFLCGAGALAGVPLLSGFWSKDAILEAAHEAGHGHLGWAYTALFVVGLFTAGLTAFYTFRAYFLTFHGELRLPPEAHGHAHESPSVMTVPLGVLALGALGAGIVLEPFTHWFSNFLDSSIDLQRASNHKSQASHLDWLMMAGSSAVVFAGIALAYWMYRVKPSSSATLVRKFPSWYYASLNRFYVDEIYNALFVKPLVFLALLARGVEALVYDIVRLIAFIPRGVAEAIRPLQNGLVQFYALTTAMGVAAFIGYLVFFAK
jgi:proton-translocating NADH-quinone oxidoreductase chain L